MEYHTLADLLSYWERGELTLAEVLAYWRRNDGPDTAENEELLRELLRALIGLERRMVALERRG